MECKYGGERPCAYINKLPFRRCSSVCFLLLYGQGAEMLIVNFPFVREHFGGLCHYGEGGWDFCPSCQLWMEWFGYLGDRCTRICRKMPINTPIGENIKLYETRNCVIHTTQEKRWWVQGLDGYIVAQRRITHCWSAGWARNSASKNFRRSKYSFLYIFYFCIHGVYAVCYLPFCLVILSLPCRKADSGR